MNTTEPRHVTRKQIAVIVGLSVRQVSEGKEFAGLESARVHYGGKPFLYQWRKVKPMLLAMGFDLYGI